MKAVAVLPGKPNSVHLLDIPAPEASTTSPTRTSAASPRGARCASRCSRWAWTPQTARSTRPSTARPRPAANHLVIGHESFGQVVEVGAKVSELVPGDYVSCTVRRPGGSLFDAIGRNDITSEEEYYERGINLCHGYLTESFVDDAEYMVKVPREPQAPGRPVGARQRLREGDRAGDARPAAVAGLEPEAGVRDGRGADRPPCDDDAQAARDGGPHPRDQARPAPQIRDRRSLWRLLRQHEGDLAGRAGQARRQARPDLRGDRQRRGLLPRDGSPRPQRRPRLDEHHRRFART